MYSGKIAVPPGGGGIGEIYIFFSIYSLQILIVETLSCVKIKFKNSAFSNFRNVFLLLFGNCLNEKHRCMQT
jgi:hypothetical protein